MGKSGRFFDRSSLQFAFGVIFSVGVSLVCSSGFAATFPATGASPLTAEQMAAAESFMVMKELPVTVEGTEVTFSGKSISGKVGDEFILKMDSLPQVASTEGQQELYRVEAFSAVGKGAELPYMVRDGLKIDPGSPGTGRVRVAFVSTGQNQALNLIIRDSAGTPVGRVSDLLLNIASPFDDSSSRQKNPPIEALRLPFPWWAALLVILILSVVFGAVIFGLYRWSRNRVPPQPDVLQVPERPEDVAALDALAAIERQEWMKKRQFKPHYFGVSETLKRYLGRRFGVNALESTSGELVELLRARATLTDRELTAVMKLFDRLDWVKFTDAVPESQEGGEVLSSARQLVLQTRRRGEGAPNAL